jgi:hypothetical protein
MRFQAHFGGTTYTPSGAVVGHWTVLRDCSVRKVPVLCGMVETRRHDYSHIIIDDRFRTGFTVEQVESLAELMKTLERDPLGEAQREYTKET